MYWKKVFGEKMYQEIVEFIGDRKMSVSALVRLAVEEYMENRKAR